jgi:hypothetical protein
VSLPPLPPLPTGGLTGQPVPTNPLVAPGATNAAGVEVSGGESVPSATVIEPVTGSRRGLPVLIAAVLLVGLACGYGRVLLAIPSAVADRARGRSDS